MLPASVSAGARREPVLSSLYASDRPPGCTSGHDPSALEGPPLQTLFSCLGQEVMEEAKIQSRDAWTLRPVRRLF
jgi:hypothetical protein